VRILYWTPEFYPEITGGIEMLSWKALPAFQKRDYEFLVVTSHGYQPLPDKTEFNGIPIHRFYFREALQNPKKILLYQKQIAELKRSFDPDVVHYHFGDAFCYFHVATARTHPAPSLVTLHMSVAGYLGGSDTVIGRLLRQASWVVGVSEATLADARQTVPDIAQRSSVIHNCLDIPHLSPQKLNFDKPRLLCLGRVIDVKGFDLAIAAFPELRRRFPNCRLIIAGDGPARPDLERQANALGLTDVVDFLGWIEPENVPELINKATIVLVPSRWREPFPLVALQAAQMARPLVAARVGGLPELIIHQQTGVLIDKEDIQQLVEAVAFLLKNPKIAVQYGQAGRKRSEDVFGMARYIDAYDALYRYLVKNDARDRQANSALSRRITDK
jgi:glycogen synthase